jgi:hypothetical protein
VHQKFLVIDHKNILKHHNNDDDDDDNNNNNRKTFRNDATT